MADEHLLWMVGGSPNVKAYFAPRLQANGLGLLGHWEGPKDFERPVFPTGATAILLLQDGASTFQRETAKDEARSRGVKLIRGMRSWEYSAAVIADAIKRRVEVEPGSAASTAEADRILGPTPAPKIDAAAIARQLSEAAGVQAHQLPPEPPPSPIPCPTVNGKGHGRHPLLPASGCPFCQGRGSVPGDWTRPPVGDGDTACRSCGRALLDAESGRCLYCSTYVSLEVVLDSSAPGQPPVQTPVPPRGAAPAAPSARPTESDTAGAGEADLPPAAPTRRPRKGKTMTAAVTPTRAQQYAEALLLASNGKLSNSFVQKRVREKVGALVDRVYLLDMRKRLGNKIGEPEHSRGVSSLKEATEVWTRMKKEGRVPEPPPVVKNGVEHAEAAPKLPSQAALTKGPRAPRAPRAPKTTPQTVTALQPLTKFQEKKITNAIEESRLPGAKQLAAHVLDTFDHMHMHKVTRLVLGLSEDGGAPVFEWAYLPPAEEKHASVDL